MKSAAGCSVLALAAWLAVTPVRAAQAAKSEPITVAVDASDAPRKFLRATLTIPAQPGPLTLYYPKWIPGEHGPTGPITDLAGLKIQAAGKAIPWQRDDLDMYAFHCTVPKDVTAIDVTLNFLSPATTSGFSGGGSMTPNLAVISWNHLVLYPKTRAMRDIECRPSLRLPAGWKLGTALATAGQKGDWTEFAPVSLETLVDSPVICGMHFRDVPLGSAKDNGHSIAMAGESAAALEMSPAVKHNLDRLVDEGGRLFGTRHYKSYKFLLALSDNIAHFGLEHHESSDNRVPERVLLDDRIRKSSWAQLLPHEYVHSWNGKYRRPADMVTDTFHEPQRTKLLWVYEGLTQYLGVVLTARCGLWTPGQFRDNLAQIAEWAQNQRGRTWRPLEDTAVAAQLLFSARGDWASWRRSVDFYDEGVLLWLDVDTLIRSETKGKRSLDDVCRRFHGGKGGKLSLKPFTLDDLIADLDAVCPHDWKTLLSKRLTATSPEAPLDGIHRAGWKLAYADKPSDYFQATETENKSLDLTASLGALLKDDGTVLDVMPGKVAHKSGIGPGMKVIAVDGRRWSATGMRAALAASKDTGRIELIVENGEFFRNVSVPYRDGARYPRLERDGGGMDLIAEIVRPLGESGEAKQPSRRTP